MRHVTSVLFGAILLVISPRTDSEREGGGLTVFAASSLTEAFREIGAEFEKREPGTTVRFNFAGSQQLAAQIELAGGADVFASADEHWIHALKEKSLLAGEPRRCGRNTLMLVLPAANPGNIRRLEDLSRPGLRLVLAGPTVPAGRYGRTVIERLAFSEGYPPDFAQRVFRNVVSHEESVRGVLGKVLLGEADGGLVYRTDLGASPSSGLRWIEIPDDASVIVHYLVTILRQSSRQPLARRFVDFACSPAGQAILEKHGFLRAHP